MVGLHLLFFFLFHNIFRAKRVCAWTRWACLRVIVTLFRCAYKSQNGVPISSVAVCRRRRASYTYTIRWMHMNFPTSATKKKTKRKKKNKIYTHNFHITYYWALHMVFESHPLCRRRWRRQHNLTRKRWNRQSPVNRFRLKVISLDLRSITKMKNLSSNRSNFNVNFNKNFMPQKGKKSIFALTTWASL